MASTYTDRIGLEKQGDGENANTWGLRLNTNVIDLVDEAVAGYETVNVSAATSVVLTDTDGVSNQARNLGLKFTGLLTADTTVTIPAQEKIYFIQNNTTGNYTLFLKPAGGTAVSVVDSGRSMIVATDGSTINSLESVDLDVVATKDELAATSATLQTRIEAVSLTMATSIATVSSTLNTRITNVSAAITTRANAVSATARAGYTDASAMTSGTVASGRLSGTYTINISGNATSATNATYAVTATNARNASYATSAGYAANAGNAATATALKTARTIGGVSFNGTSNINLPGVNIAGNQNTSGNAATATFATSATNATNAVNAGYASSAGSVAWGNVSSKPTLATYVGSYSTGYLGDGANGNFNFDIPSPNAYGTVPIIKWSLNYYTYFGGYASRTCFSNLVDAYNYYNGSTNLLRLVFNVNGGGQKWPHTITFYFYE
jgi:hypothetical protein